MFKRLICAALVFGAAALAPPPDAASSEAAAKLVQGAPMALCLPRAAIAEHLATRYGESRHGAGLQGAAAIIEIWTSRDTGTWTLLLTRPTGLSCVLGAGTDWRDVPADPNAADPHAKDEPS